MAVVNTEVLDTTSDIATTTTLLHETIPITGSILSGTYGTLTAGGNIKNYTHGMFQSVYDYPYLSSSANHIFDLTVGYDENSKLSSTTNTQNSKKLNLYNQFAQVLLGYTSSNSDGIKKFESDLNLDGVGTMHDCFFLSFSRLLGKDQIKRNSFSMTIGTGSWAGPTPFTKNMVLTDASASVSSQGVKNVNGGDYAVLYDAHNDARGVIFYQAGIVVLSGSVFSSASLGAGAGVADFYKHPTHGNQTWRQAITGASISGACDALRHRIQNISFNNTTEINSKIYFCRVPHNKFNYSANPTYVSGSKIRVKNVASDNPVSYITTVGLYNAAGELLAVAKLSEPLRKDPSNDLTIRVRLDY
jgi:hypothetical protein